jgi:hypothetical protein
MSQGPTCCWLVAFPGVGRSALCSLSVLSLSTTRETRREERKTMVKLKLFDMTSATMRNSFVASAFVALTFLPLIDATCLSNSTLEAIFGNGTALPRQDSCCMQDICGLTCPTDIPGPRPGMYCLCDVLCAGMMTRVWYRHLVVSFLVSSASASFLSFVPSYFSHLYLYIYIYHLYILHSLYQATALLPLAVLP